MRNEKCKFQIDGALLRMRPAVHEAANNLQFSFCNLQFAISSRKTTSEIL